MVCKHCVAHARVAHARTCRITPEPDAPLHTARDPHNLNHVPWRRHTHPLLHLLPHRIRRGPQPLLPSRVRQHHHKQRPSRAPISHHAGVGHLCAWAGDAGELGAGGVAQGEDVARGVEARAGWFDSTTYMLVNWGFSSGSQSRCRCVSKWISRGFGG
jgi:hypothetical protein